MKYAKKSFEYFSTILLAVLSSLNYAIFIFPNRFAPSGIDGICTMIQDITKVSMGYLSFVINIPLLIFAFFLLGRNFFIKTAIYVSSFSLATVCVQYIDISTITYQTDNSIVLAPIAAGTIRGLLYVYTLKLNASSGGTDIIGAIIKRKHPQYNFMNIIFVINMLIALCSYFVYGFRPEPVICSIIYALITSSISNHFRAKEHKKIKFEIITPYGDDLCSIIFDKFNQTATKVEARGAYSGKNNNMIVCVIEKNKASDMEEILRNLPETVFFISTVNDSIE